jgi:cytochrome c551/c552
MLSSPDPRNLEGCSPEATALAQPGAQPRTLARALAVLFAAIVPASGQAAGVVSASPKELFSMYCAPCHQLDVPSVGPALIEIGHLYRTNAAGLVAWARKPGRKRPETIEMPPMDVVPVADLQAIAGYILSLTQGRSLDEIRRQVELYPSLVTPLRPRVQRLFMPGAGPAAIAVALPGRFSYCWDAGTCHLRYVWHGEFIDPMPVWRGKGDGRAQVKGEILLRARAQNPFAAAGGSDGALQFLGYRLVRGLPEFEYAVGRLRVRERIEPLPAGHGIAQSFSVSGLDGPLRWPLPVGETAQVKASVGELRDGQLALSAHEAEHFTIWYVFPEREPRSAFE